MKEWIQYFVTSTFGQSGRGAKSNLRDTHRIETLQGNMIIFLQYIYYIYMYIYIYLDDVWGADIQ